MTEFNSMDQSMLSYPRNSPYLMEPKGSLPCTQERANGLYPEPHESNQTFKIRFNNILPSAPRSPPCATRRFRIIRLNCSFMAYWEMIPRTEWTRKAMLLRQYFLSPLHILLYPFSHNTELSNTVHRNNHTRKRNHKMD